MLIGAHISAAGGAVNAPKNAHQAGCEVFQFFSRSPRGGKAPELSAQEIREFKQNMKNYKQKECYIHAPYYINLASGKNNIYYGSISVLREELERGSLLGAKYMMTHLGSAKDLGKKAALKKVAKGIIKVLDGYKGSAQFLIEMSAGAGEIIGDKFEEIAEIIKLVEKNLKFIQVKQGQNKRPARWPVRRSVKGLFKNEGGSVKESLGSGSGWSIGVCYDTAHAFASGYDIRDKKSLKKTLNEFDKIISLKKLKLIHINDSKSELGSHIDRHEHIGYGKIGREGFYALLHESRLKNINLILETPVGRVDDIKILKELRK